MTRTWLRASERWLTVLAWLGAAGLVVLGGLLSVRNETDFRRANEREVQAQAAILSDSLTAALAFDDRSTMRQYLEALHSNRQIAGAAVYDAAGHTLVVMQRHGEPSPPAKAPAEGTGWQGGRVQSARKAIEQGQTLGEVFLETREDTAADVLQRHGGMALLTVMGLLFLVMVSWAAANLETRARELSEANDHLKQEIEARAAAEAALRQSQKMEALGQLTGGIAHDFNNLLQVIMGALDLIRRKPGEIQKVENWAGNALQAAERGASLSRQLLAFSRTQRMELRPFVVAELVEGMRDLLLRTLGNEIELVMDLDTAHVPVLSDRTQLELALLNLAINARDAMPDGGVLTVRTRIDKIGEGHPDLAPDDYVALSVEDTGAGMPADVAARAFDPFFTTKPVGSGTGLGLSQVYGVARQAGGEARIESTPGRGTKVTVLLRRSPEGAKAPAAGPAPSTLMAPALGAQVLVVDDDDQVRSLVSDSLELLGYNVIPAGDGAEALAILRKRRPDIALLDFAMPQMNGAQLAQRARAIWPDLPIVFASGHADTDAIAKAVGQVDIVRKPFDMETLAHALGTALSQAPPPA